MSKGCKMGKCKCVIKRQAWNSEHGCEEYIDKCIRCGKVYYHWAYGVVMYDIEQEAKRVMYWHNVFYRSLQKHNWGNYRLRGINGRFRNTLQPLKQQQ